MNKFAYGLCGLVLMASTQARTGGVHLRQLRRIHVPPNAHWAEALAAKVLQEQLGKHYGVEPEVTEGQTAAGTPAVFVGREQAVASGLVTVGEVEKTKHDGFVIKSAGNRIALAGYRGRGSLYAAYALLERMGVRMYPDRSSWTGPVEVLEPLPDQVLPAVDEMQRPFFEYRGCRSGVNQGRFWGGWW